MRCWRIVVELNPLQFASFLHEAGHFHRVLFCAIAGGQLIGWSVLPRGDLCGTLKLDVMPAVIGFEQHLDPFEECVYAN